MNVRSYHSLGSVLWHIEIICHLEYHHITSEYRFELQLLSVQSNLLLMQPERQQMMSHWTPCSWLLASTWKQEQPVGVIVEGELMEVRSHSLSLSIFRLFKPAGNKALNSYPIFVTTLYREYHFTEKGNEVNTIIESTKKVNCFFFKI